MISYSDWSVEEVAALWMTWLKATFTEMEQNNLKKR